MLKEPLSLLKFSLILKTDMLIFYTQLRSCVNKENAFCFLRKESSLEIKPVAMNREKESSISMPKGK